jgi:uncharacterized membrane protein
MFYIVLLAVATGMRTFTGIAVMCWAAYLGYLPVEGTWAFWTAKLVTVIVVTLLALGEYWGDTRPSTPSRTALLGVTARLGFGVLVGMVAATALGQPKAGGFLLGVIGALIGTYGGHRARARIAQRVGRDLPVALGESALAVGFAVLALSHIHRDIAAFAAMSAMLVR